MQFISWKKNSQCPNVLDRQSWLTSCRYGLNFGAARINKITKVGLTGLGVTLVLTACGKPDVPTRQDVIALEEPPAEASGSSFALQNIDRLALDGQMLIWQESVEPATMTQLLQTVRGNLKAKLQRLAALSERAKLGGTLAEMMRMQGDLQKQVATVQADDAELQSQRLELASGWFEGKIEMK